MGGTRCGRSVKARKSTDFFATRQSAHFIDVHMDMENKDSSAGVQCSCQRCRILGAEIIIACYIVESLVDR